MEPQSIMFKPKNYNSAVYKCVVRLLEDSDVLECEFQGISKGKYLTDYICDQLNIKERDYFGLRYVDFGSQRQWLDPAKSIIKQCKGMDPLLFSFRVKFYPADPFRLSGVARIMLYQQLKRDLRHGRLSCSVGEGAQLGSLVVQEELGDYNANIHVENYISCMHLVLRQTESLEKNIMDLHKKRPPQQNPTAAIDEFLHIAKNLETYGIEPHAVKDHRGSHLYIGINHAGISTFLSGKRSQHLRWGEIQKLNFEGKMFIVHLSFTDASREVKKHTLGFKCMSNAACRYVWRSAIEQMLFFTLPSSQNPYTVSGGGFFSWGMKFKYTGRTEREIIAASLSALREQKMNRERKASSVPTTPSSPQGKLSQIRYCSLPRSTMSEPLNSNFKILKNYDNSSMPFYKINDISKFTGQENGLVPVSEVNHLNTSQLDNSSTETVFDMSCPERNRLMNSKTTALRSTSILTSGHVKNSSATNAFLKKNSYSYKDSENKRKFQLVHAFVPSFFIVVFFMGIITIWILESETELFAQVRNMPEMINLRYQYYQPLKDFILKRNKIII